MPCLATAVLLIIWEICCIVFEVPEIILPRPTRIFTVFVARFDILVAYCWDTLWTTVIGFLLAIAGGLLLGLAIGASPFVYSGLYPLLIAFHAIPQVALVAILIDRGGRGLAPGRHHRLRHQLLSHRGERRDRACHHRARDARRASKPRRHPD